MKTISLVVILFLFSLACVDSHADSIGEQWRALSKEDKVLYANAGAMLAITAWGVAQWDYGERSAHADSEGWFGKNTKTGGADKLGHLYSTYVTGRALSALYRSWGYGHRQAAEYGAWSSLGLLGFMEVGDAFSETYGFSYEDFIMNGIGSYIGYLLELHPGLDRKIDLRYEYKPGADNGIDIFTDYENSKYLVAIKMDGFSAVRNRYLKYLEWHLGYYTRGYDTPGGEKARNVYVGIGINLSKLLREKSWHRTATVLEYYQVPYTDLQYTQ